MTGSRDTYSRRAALQRMAGLALVAIPSSLGAAVLPLDVKHPEPRPGITADGVLPDEHVPKKSKKAYEAARAIPGVLDGLYCHCDCAERDGLRSLLSCFETRMPFNCGVCRREAELAFDLHRKGRSLDEIRAAVDKEFG
jgi:hypothetical protein